ncbi:MAG: hypothetical protein HQL75_10545 [Magnetococcales bacterium]|nr:hypothetical protein [Magnetococcales bacterium]
MILDRFSYYFSVEGNEGGVFSLTFKFVPDNATTMQVMKDFERLESLLDWQFLADENGIGGEKIPTLSDSPAGIETGFKYKGRNRDLPYSVVRIFASTLSSMFFLDRLRKVKPAKPSINSFMSLSASLRCHMGKHERSQSSPVLELDIQAGHNLNLAMFDAILGLPDMNIGMDAEINMKNLRQMLAMGRQIDPKQYLEMKE